MTQEATEQSVADDLPQPVLSDISVADSNGVGASRLLPADAPAKTTDDAELTGTVHAHAAVSQPMTASTSSSSNPSLKDTPTGTASPYGTRSRNRAGVTRPNYAEDREMEIEFEVQPSREDEMRKNRPGDPLSTALTDTAGPPSANRRALPTEYNSNGQSSTKDQIPGTSTFSANPSAASTSQPSKKRKAAGQPSQSSTNTPLPIINSMPLGSQPNTRRASIATQSVAIGKETSMLSFDNCAGRLKDGKLVADDGTVLGVNGTFNRTFGLTCPSLNGFSFLWLTCCDER